MILEVLRPLCTETAGHISLHACGDPISTVFKTACRFTELLTKGVAIMSTVTKKDLISQYAKELSIPQKQAALYFGKAIELIIANLAKDNEVDLTGFGKFTVRSRAERTGINPSTKEPIVIPSSKTVKFSPKKGLKEAVNPELADEEAAGE